MDNLRYPIGKYEPAGFGEELKRACLTDLAQLPSMVESAIANLDAEQLHTPYRPGGWTVHQVVHHLADSHVNAFCRMKLALSVENPTIKPYDENAWVQQADVEATPIEVSITLLHALHRRMYALLKGQPAEAWQRAYTHPDSGMHTLWFLLGLYAWHGRHHVAHINALRERNNW
jgi:uncharacterized damage-inducible protein DinB